MTHWIGAAVYCLLSNTHVYLFGFHHSIIQSELQTFVTRAQSHDFIMFILSYRQNTETCTALLQFNLMNYEFNNLLIVIYNNMMS